MDSLDEFTSLLQETEYIDTRYDVAGSAVWLPYGLRARELFFRSVQDQLLEQGYKRYEFPYLLPETYLNRQKDAVASFEDDVCWVTAFGHKQLDEHYYLRPTGEAQIYPVVENWFLSQSDLPLKMLLCQPRFRASSTGTPLLMGQGLTMMEGHGLFASQDDAAGEISKAIQYLESALKIAGLDPFTVERPLWGNNPVSESTYGFDIVTPFGQTLMVAALYLQGTIYSKPYNLRFQTKDNQMELLSTINWGLSTRVFAASLLLLADESGLRVMPDFSPVQVVFIPISNEPEEINRCQELAENISARTKVDSSSLNVGQKFSKWDRKGVPIRVEIGQEELSNKILTIIRRDTSNKQQINLSSVESVDEFFTSLLQKITETLYDEISQQKRNSVTAVESSRELEGVIQNGDIAVFNYCGNQECGTQIESDLPGEILGIDVHDQVNGECIICQTITDQRAFYARRF